VKLRLALLALPLVVACVKRAPSPPPPPEIVDVRVNYRSQGQPGAPVLDVAALGATARTTIAAASGLIVHEDAGSDAPKDARARRYKLRVDVALEGGIDDKSKEGVMHALVSAQLIPVGAEPGALSFEQQALAEARFNSARHDADWQGHATRAVKDCVTGVGARVKLAAGNAPAIVAAIDGNDDDLREEAMRIAAERHVKEAVPPLLRRLKSDEPAERDRAIGALSEIGDARAVRPLTEVAKFYDVTDLPKVLDALATIGGPEARSYLEFVASGHDSPEMRELAKQALLHLDRREAERRRDLGAPSTRRTRHFFNPP
jgi:hypothetical protein